MKVGRVKRNPFRENSKKEKILKKVPDDLKICKVHSRPNELLSLDDTVI